MSDQVKSVSDFFNARINKLAERVRKIEVADSKFEALIKDVQDRVDDMLEQVRDMKEEMIKRLGYEAEVTDQGNVIRGPWTRKDDVEND